MSTTQSSEIPQQPEVLPEWKLERHYIPALITLDGVTQNANTLNWSRTARAEPEFIAAKSKFLSPEYTGSDPVAWGILTKVLDVRNEISAICKVRERKRLDRTIGYILHPHVLSSLQLTEASLPRCPDIFTEKLQGINVTEEELRTCFLPIMRHIDYVVSNLERLIWEEEYPLQRSDHATNEAIHAPTYGVPNALRRNTLLEVRNTCARECKLPERTPHDLNLGKAPWHVEVPGWRNLDPNFEVPTSPRFAITQQESSPQ